MKNGLVKRVLPAVLTLAMMLSLLPVSVFAATPVKTEPGGTDLQVEYINSTLYNWVEADANVATAAVDYVTSSEPTYVNQQTSTGAIKWSNLASSNVSRNSTGYYIQLTADSQYYPTYITRTSSKGTLSYTLEYLKEGGYYTVAVYTGSNAANNWPASTDGTFSVVSGGNNDSIALYTYEAGGSYEGKGFYFTDATIPEGVTVEKVGFSGWDNINNDSNGTAMQQYSYYSGLAASKLSESSNKPFSDAVNAADLFGDTEYTWKNVYTNVGVPFVYDATTGYYELNSDKNAVYFEGGSPTSGASASELAKLKIANAPACFSWDNGKFGNTYYASFQPFNAVKTSTTKAYASTENTEGKTIDAYQIDNYTDDSKWGFGMVTEINFQMTDDGKDADGNPITFEFSGDDDVWVYVDGVLALDLGGTHDALQGTIDFSTGEVTVRSERYGLIRDKNPEVTLAGDGKNGTTEDGTNGIVKNSYVQRDLYVALNTTLTGFASQGTHTLTIYYMDRGRGATNCTIQFNLPQRDSVSVSKNIAENYANTTTAIPSDVMATLNNIDFHFTAYKNGTIVPNKSYSIYDTNNNLIGTGSTDASGGFTLKNGQTATFKNISLDEQVSYYIVEDTSSLSGRWTAPSWTATSTVTGATITDSNGATSGTVTVTGSETAADSVTFVCTNSYTYVSGLAVDTSDDTIVIDYGLPVEVDVLHDDIISNGTVTSLTADNGTYGTVTVTADNKLIYTLNTPLSGIDTVTYTVSATDSVDGKTATDTGTLTIIPATSMYYEETFSGMITYSTGKIAWTNEGSALPDYQETDFVGTDTTNPTSTYGSDKVYQNNLGDSYGTSKWAHAEGYAAQFKYDFTGTGTAIYSRISPDSAYISVEVRQTIDSTTTVVNQQYIDTRVIGEIATNETLYNIPVYNNDSLGYGTYTVVVTVYKQGTPTNAGPSGANFYLDGIRVYNPMYDDPTAASAYAADGEANTAIINIRDKILADDEYVGLGEFITLTDTEENITTAEEYASIGPNHELYLGEGYTINFSLIDWDTQAYQLYIGMKSPAGSAASVQVGSQTITLNNSADCYYNISNYVSVEAVDFGTEDEPELKNVGTVTITGVSGLISLTNIKVTGIEPFNLGYATNEDVDENGNPITGDTGTSKARTLLLAPTSLIPMSEAEEEEPVTFTPEQIKLSCSYGKLTKWATVTVLTSSDVAYLTIDGKQVTGIKIGGSYLYTRTFTKVASGTTFEVIAYNADGVASEVYTVTATAKAGR